MTVLRINRNRAIRKKYIDLRARKVSPEAAREMLAKEFFLAEPTIKQILFDQKYYTGKRHVKV